MRVTKSRAAAASGRSRATISRSSGVGIVGMGARSTASLSRGCRKPLGGPGSSALSNAPPIIASGARVFLLRGAHQARVPEYLALVAELVEQLVGGPGFLLVEVALLHHPQHEGVGLAQLGFADLAVQV